MTNKSHLFCFLCALMVSFMWHTNSWAQKNPYGFKEKAVHRIDSLLDVFFELRYSDLPAAKKSALEAQKLAEDQHDSENYSIATECIGLAEYYAGEYTLARHDLMKALMLYNDLKLQRGISSACNNLAMIEQDQGNLNRAIMLYNIAIRADSILDDSIGTGFTLNNLGTAYLYKGELSTALSYFNRAKVYGDLTGEYELKSDVMINSALLYHESDQQNEALTLYASTLEMAQNANDEFTIAVVTINIGDVYCKLRQYTLAWEYYQKGLEMAQEIDNPEVIADCLSNMGNLLQQQNKHAKANDYYLQALKLYEELGNKKKIGSSLTSMGISLMTRNNFEKSIDYFHQSLKIIEPIEAMPEIAANFKQLCLAWAAMHQFDSATNYIERYNHAQLHMVSSDFKLPLPTLPDSITNDIEAFIAQSQISQPKSTISAFVARDDQDTKWWVVIVLGIIIFLMLPFTLKHFKKRQSLKRKTNT